jgi:tetratricopeptide (TPR) repeat protein
VLAMQGQHSEAEQILRSALRGNPRDTRIWRALGTLLVNSGRPEQAIAPLSETLAANPANRIALASALVRAGRLNEARGQAGLLSAPTRSTFELLTDLAADFSTVGEFDEAERLLSSILGRFPLAHRARLGLAYVLLDAGKIDEAHAQFSQIVLFLPDNAAAIAGMAECLQKQGRSDKAAALFEDVLSRLAIDDIHNSYAWFLATCADPDYRNPVKAMAQLREIQPALLETNSYYQGTLAATFAAQGDYSAAVVAAEKSIRLAESAGDRALAENTRERLALYRQGRPYINSTEQSP